MSSEHPMRTASSRHYADAYAKHYRKSDLLGALGDYTEIIEQFPNAPEADYSRAQIRNIVNLVMPGPELLAAQVALVRERLETAAAR